MRFRLLILVLIGIHIISFNHTPSGAVLMNQQKEENPYEVILDSELQTEAAETKSEGTLVPMVGVITLTPLITLFCFSFLFNLEAERFSFDALFNVMFSTGVTSLIASVLLPVLWAVAGFLVRRKDIPPLTKLHARPIVFKWIASCVLFLGIVPTVIEGFSTTYPISEYTLSYFLLLALTLFFVILDHFLTYRHRPNQKFAFVCLLGGIMVIITVGLIGLLFFAIAASAAT